MKSLTEISLVNDVVYSALRERIITPCHFVNIETETVSEYGLTATVYKGIPTEEKTDLVCIGDKLFTTSSNPSPYKAFQMFHSMDENEIKILSLLFSKDSPVIDFFKDNLPGDMKSHWWGRYGGYFLRCDVVYETQINGRSKVTVEPSNAMETSELPSKFYEKAKEFYAELFGTIDIDSRLLGELAKAATTLSFWAKYGNGLLTKTEF